MPHFDMNQLALEISSIMILQAQQIFLCLGDRNTPFDFLHMESYGEGASITEIDPSKIDLDRFPIAQSLFKFYSYAFYPKSINQYDVEESNRIHEFLSGIPRDDFSGMLRAFPSEEGPFLCLDTLDVADARASIDGQNVELTPELSVRQIALLADVTEDTIRNALTEQGEGGLRASPKYVPARVEVGEARRWLADHPNFRPTPKMETASC